MGRGLSPVQNAIMNQARLRGYITPAKAFEASWTDKTFCSRNAMPKVAATASRALKRLCRRVSLWYDPRRYVGQNSVYRVTGWVGCLPWIETQQRMNSDLMAEAELSQMLAKMPASSMKG